MNSRVPGENVTRNGLVKQFSDIFSWRWKRLLQYIRVRFKSWRTPEVVIAGVSIPLTKCISDNIREAMFHGGYEAAELRTIDANLSRDDLVLEIGTGIGLISTYCAKKIGSNRVFTFEANPALEPYIRSVHARNGVAPDLRICALGQGEGEIPFYVHDDFWSSSIYQRSTNSRRLNIPRRDLNETIAQLRPTFLIVDIEGGESELFEFINLDGIHKISIEIHTSIIGKTRVDEIHSILAHQGFAIDWRYSQLQDDFKQELYLSRKPH